MKNLAKLSKPGLKFQKKSPIFHPRERDKNINKKTNKKTYKQRDKHSKNNSNKRSNKSTDKNIEEKKEQRSIDDQEDSLIRKELKELIKRSYRRPHIIRVIRDPYPQNF